MTENTLNNEQNELLSNDIGVMRLEVTRQIYSQNSFLPAAADIYKIALYLRERAAHSREWPS
jgi:hypothetical protein